jgi:putative ABC transport system substrate-binding protein
VIGRRQCIFLLGGVAAAWPIPAHAQQQQMPVIGFLHSGSAELYAGRVAAFRQGLIDLGFVEGKDFKIEKSGDNPDLKAWAAKTLPHLKEHLALAKKLH